MLLATLLALSLAAPDLDRAPPARPVASVEGGETLGSGGAEVAVSAGFSKVSAAYLQAWSDAVDLGAAASIDWLTSEILAGGLYRSLLWRSGATSAAWSARAGLYSNLGADWAVSANRGGTGVQVSPGLAISRRLASGLLSLRADVPLTVTFDRGGGYAVGLQGAVVFETPLWGDLLVGARAGGGALWSTSDAPFGGDSPRAVLDLAALLTYRLF